MGAKYLVLLLVLLAQPAWAQTQPCYSTAAVMEMIVSAGQIAYEGGKEQSGLPAVIFVNPDNLTWTMVVQPRDGYLCIVSKGQGWERRTPRPAGKLS